MMIVRKAEKNDIPRIMEIFEAAKVNMAKAGNPNQWHDGYPWLDIVEEDVQHQECYVILNSNRLVGTFTFILGNEPGYEQIRGKWLNNDPYGTIHRLAGDGTTKGIFKTAIEYCRKILPNIKIDTHADNSTMQYLLNKEGFTKCGLIIGQDNVDRLAYQKTYS